MPYKKFWFPAKKYGWGWGVPIVWQGWAVLAIFLILLVIGAFQFLPNANPVVFIVYSILLCAILMAVCWLKGEPPRWRWGQK